MTDVKVAAGDAVTKGQTLATADTSSLKRDLVAARAQLKVAQDQKRLADTQLGDATTTAAKRQGRISVNNAIAQVTNAQATVSQLEDQIAWATIVAPADGVVTDVAVAAGANAPRAPPSSSPPGRSGPAADFAEGDLAALEVGQRDRCRRCHRRHPPGDRGRHRARRVDTVRRLGRDLRRDRRSGRPPADARPGMTAEVTVTTERRPAS